MLKGYRIFYYKNTWRNSAGRMGASDIRHELIKKKRKVWGKQANILLGNNGHGDKITRQRKEIKKFLNNNPDNYWVNTSGFENLILELK
jgi:hypothetical protein